MIQVLTSDYDLKSAKRERERDILNLQQKNNQNLKRKRQDRILRGKTELQHTILSAGFICLFPERERQTFAQT